VLEEQVLHPGQPTVLSAVHHKEIVEVQQVFQVVRGVVVLVVQEAMLPVNRVLPVVQALITQ
jgi:hypothetical protein